MAFPKISLSKSALMLCIFSAHALLLYLLINMKPAKWVAAGHPKVSVATPESVTVLEFITRPSRAINNKAPAPPPKNRAAIPKGMQAEFRATDPSSSDDQIAASAVDASAAKLILSLPEPKIDFSPPPRNLLAKPRNTLETPKTRFSKAWKPDGNVVDSLKWKSKTVNSVLGLFGGNKKICTDEDRRNLDPVCVPDNYRPEQ